MNDAAKAVKFCGGALDDLRAFVSSARRAAGYELDKVQNGRDPSDWKPMNSVGAGVREIRIRDAKRCVPDPLCGEIRRDCLCAALFSEEEAGDQQNRPRPSR